jgi:hypothetical protein
LRCDFRANDYSELESVRLSSAEDITAAHTVQKLSRSINYAWSASPKFVTLTPQS